VSTLRAFIAVDLTPDIRAQLEALAGRLRRLPGQEGLRFVAAAGVHLSVKFLGEISPALAADLGGALDTAARRVPAFAIRVQGIGCFPNPRQPRVLWVGLHDPRRMLLALQSAVEEACADLRLPKEDRAFSPHLTLARVRREGGAAAGGFVGSVLECERGLDLGEMPVDAICLFRSELRPNGAVYTRIHSAALSGDA
jgi:2'-5' RNA ligase